MPTLTSADHTTIAYDRRGTGPALVLVAGAFNDRQATAPLAARLAPTFDVINVDRRGRGESGDADAYAVEREIDDLAAVLTTAGGEAAVLGYSSGANLVLEAAAAGLPISHVLTYDAPYAVGDDDARLPAGFAERLAGLVAGGHRGEAVELYQSVAVGLPEHVVAQLRDAPFRPHLEAIAHTLAYDAAVLGDLSLPAERLARITAPALVMAGEHSPPVMQRAAAALATTLPAATRVTVAGQDHTLNPDAVAPHVEAFLAP